MGMTFVTYRILNDLTLIFNRGVTSLLAASFFSKGHLDECLVISDSMAVQPSTYFTCSLHQSFKVCKVNKDKTLAKNSSPFGTTIQFKTNLMVKQGDRDVILQELTQKEKLCKEQEQELERYRECDPEVLENMQKETVMAKEGANRWTDNVFTIKSWCVRKFGLEEKMIDKNFGIPEDFDYVEQIEIQFAKM